MRLVSELRRRNVFRMALLYMGAAWLIMQVVDLLIDRGPFPDSIGPITLTVLAIGFPIALIISWFYELTPEGISLDTDEAPAVSATGFTGRRVDFVIISLLAAAVLVFAYDKWWIGPPPERSVAVLPFVNMSTDEYDADIGAGVAETILLILAQVPELHVTSRTSSFQPRLYGLSVPEIAEVLGVATVLEGSVQKYGNELRITAQLIDAGDDSHLWSGNFDRDYSDIFEIQDEIAEAVTSALKLTLLDETIERLDLQSTDNLQAYTEFMLAQNNLFPPSAESLWSAVTHLGKALQLDPSYVRAWSTLGRVYNELWVYEFIGRSAGMAAARNAALRALEIDTLSSEAMAVIGWIDFVSRRRDSAIEYLQRAADVGPNDVLAQRYYANSLLYSGQFEEAAKIHQRLLRLDPLEDDNYIALIEGAQKQRRFDDVLPLIDILKDLTPALTRPLWVEQHHYFLQGKYADAVRVLREMLRLESDEARISPIILNIARDYLILDAPDEAEYWFDQAIAIDKSLSPKVSLYMNAYRQRFDEESFALASNLLRDSAHPSEYVREATIMRTFALLVLNQHSARYGNNDTVLELLSDLFPATMNSTLRDDSNQDREIAYYGGLASMRAGDTTRGTRLLGSVMAAYERDYSWGVPYVSITGRMALGRKQEAMEKLRELTRDKWYYTDLEHLLTLQYDSVLDPIRNEPAFIELLDMYDKNAAEQRKLLTQMAHGLPVK